MIALVTGEIGCGKTTACRRAIDLLRERGVPVSGILSPARFDINSNKIGIDALDVATGERRPLADVVPGGRTTIGRYTFDAQTMDWAIGRLQEAITVPRRAGDRCVLVLDEIGPLELRRQGGFAALLDPLADPDLVPRGLVIVRREYVEILERRISRADVRRFPMDEVCRERVPVELAKVLSA
jgi:nucleoside-triphosphatase THEP1